MTTIDTLFEDAHLLAVQKPAGLLIIPGRVPGEETLVGRVRDYLGDGGRPFVVHRLDRGTSGVVLFAKTADAHRLLNAQFESRQVQKRYLAIVEGELYGRGQIDVPLQPARRGKMKPRLDDEPGQSALTHWKTEEAFPLMSLLEVRPRTGRQHQIRVHLKSIGHPLAFDPDYGRKIPWTAAEILADSRSSEIVLDRTPLHAAGIRFRHPATGQAIVIEAPMPADMSRVLALLRESETLQTLV